MRRLHLILFTVVFSSLAGGCIVSGTVRTRAYAEPELVYVQPGVQVVADYDEPVFYSDGYYWRYYGNVWYRSSYYSGGWVRWRSVPHAVVTIRNPHTYVHYHGRGNAYGHSNRPRAVDHRDNRVERREDRRERREDKRERREDHRERKEDRKERREDKHEDRVKVRDHRH